MSDSSMSDSSRFAASSRDEIKSATGPIVPEAFRRVAQEDPVEEQNPHVAAIFSRLHDSGSKEEVNRTQNPAKPDWEFDIVNVFLGGYLIPAMLITGSYNMWYDLHPKTDNNMVDPNRQSFLSTPYESNTSKAVIDHGGLRFSFNIENRWIEVTARVDDVDADIAREFCPLQGSGWTLPDEKLGNTITNTGVGAILKDKINTSSSKWVDPEAKYYWVDSGKGHKLSAEYLSLRDQHRDILNTDPLTDHSLSGVKKAVVFCVQSSGNKPGLRK